MNRKLAELAERREHLVAQAAMQRSLLAQGLEPWRARLALADHGVTAFRYMRNNPVLSVGVMLLMTKLRFKHAGSWLSRGLIMWQLGRRLLKH